MTGPMYFDITMKQSIAEAVAHAAGVYSAQNGGRLAKVVQVCIRQYPAPPDFAAGIRVEAVNYVLPFHYWAGDGKE